MARNLLADTRRTVEGRDEMRNRRADFSNLSLFQTPKQQRWYRQRAFLTFLQKLCLHALVDHFVQDPQSRCSIQRQTIERCAAPQLHLDGVQGQLRAGLQRQGATIPYSKVLNRDFVMNVIGRGYGTETLS